MSGKATAIAPSNIAFIKYWGIRDPERILPVNPSISMTLSRCVSRCTVELQPPEAGIEIAWRTPAGDLERPREGFRRGIEAHLDHLANRAGVSTGFRVATENTFPTGAGIASSASGFAALTLAATAALGRNETPERLSVLARESGSGSAARSVLGGYVEWPAGAEPERGYAVQLAPAEAWPLCDLVAVVDATPKRVSSRQGHRAAPTSPYFARRQELLEERLREVRQAIAERRFDRLGPVVEEEAIDLHLIALSSRPPIYYWRPATLAVLAAARQLRQQGVPVFATMDAGPNVHLICEPEHEGAVARAIGSMPEVEQLIRDRVGPGPSLTQQHLL